MSASNKPDAEENTNIEFSSNDLKLTEKKIPLSDSQLQPTSSCSDLKQTVPKISPTELSLGDEIGKGAFGVVKKADWFGTTVAVKEVVVRRMKLAKSMIERELKVHSAVRHPNILQLLAYATTENRLLLITEFIDGKNLDDLLFANEDTTQAWDTTTKISVATKITQAVAYLHNQKSAIIHRDIKP